MSREPDEKRAPLQRPRRRLYQAPEVDLDPVAVSKARPRRRSASAPAEGPANKSQKGREQQARQAIEGHVFNALALAAVPVPLFDAVAVAVVQARLVERICRIYGQPYSKVRIKSWLTGLVGGVLSVQSGLAVFRSLARVIPGPGTLLGLTAIPAFSAAATHAVGVIFHDHFRAGGSSLNFDPKKARAHYKTELKKGKGVALRAINHFKTGSSQAGV